MSNSTIRSICLVGILLSAVCCSSDSNTRNSNVLPPTGTGGYPSEYPGGPSSTTSDWTTSANPNQNVYGVWGTGPSDVWAVGYQNNILHWDGTAWSSSLTGTTGELHGVWGTGRNDVWAVGRQILHWDGASWTPTTANIVYTLYAVWGSGPNDVWAGGGSSGSSGFIMHWDGSTWTEQAITSLEQINAFWGSAANDVWAVGGEGNGLILHWDGQAWTKVLEGSSTLALFGLLGIWGNSASDVWAVGEQNIAHWDGSQWSLQSCSAYSWTVATGTSDVCPMGFTGVWGSSANDVWAVGAGGGVYGFVEHWNGLAWTMESNGMQNGLTGVWGSSASDIWAVGPGILSGGFILHHKQ